MQISTKEYDFLLPHIQQTKLAAKRRAREETTSNLGGYLVSHTASAEVAS
jgi:hypothetical protein